MFCNATSYLEQLIELACRDRKYFICVYDLSDMLKDEELFGLPFVRRFHKANFCEEIKKTPKGAQYCLKCRQFSFRKASRSDSLYVGRCYLGITEIVKPIHIGGRLCGIIYLGNMIRESEYEDVIRRIRKYTCKLGVEDKVLFEALNTVGVVSPDEVEECTKLVEMLYKSLMLAYESSQVRDRGSPAGLHIKTSFLTQCVKDYVEEYYSSNIRLEQLAQLYFVNANYLRNLFKRQTGLNFTDYLNKFRIEKAVEMLRDPEKKMINISMEVGFNNVTYFNKLFKRYKGVSPKKYRGL